MLNPRSRPSRSEWFKDYLTLANQTLSVFSVVKPKESHDVEGRSHRPINDCIFSVAGVT